MDEETKQRLRERFEQILAAQDRRAQTINDIERIALAIGGQVKQAAVEEIGQEAQTSQNPQSQNPQSKRARIQSKRARIQRKVTLQMNRRRSLPNGLARTVTKMPGLKQSETSPFKLWLALSP